MYDLCIGIAYNISICLDYSFNKPINLIKEKKQLTILNMLYDK